MSASARTDPASTAGGVTRTRRGGARWRLLAVVEVACASVVVLRDALLPTLVILVLLALSLAVRREGAWTLGFRKLRRPWRTAGQVLGLTVAWTALQLTVFMPVLEHVTHRRQDVSGFAELQGNLALLAVLLGLSWTLAALGEETVFRGYLQTRVVDVVGAPRLGLILAVALSSVLFALLHVEQGVIGVALTFLDALFLSWVRYRFRNLWAAVLAHGFNNTIGMVTFFLVGPVYALW